MADYYSLLAKAVSNLPKARPEPARNAIYERARKALVRQLRSLGPPLPEADIAREEAALETAIGRLEAQFALPSRPPRRPGAPPPPAPQPAGSRPGDGARVRRRARRPAPPCARRGAAPRIPMPDTPLARPIPPRRRRGRLRRPTPPGARPAGPPSPIALPQSSPPPRPAYPPAAGRAAADARRRRRGDGALRARRAAASRPPCRGAVARAAPPRRVEASSYLPDAPSLGRASADDYDDDDSAPQVGAADDLERAAV